MEKMMMPAYYNVLSTEEMTYTEGGANATMSEALLCWLIPPYGWFRGCLLYTSPSPRDRG